MFYLNKRWKEWKAKACFPDVTEVISWYVALKSASQDWDLSSNLPTADFVMLWTKTRQSDRTCFSLICFCCRLRCKYKLVLCPLNCLNTGGVFVSSFYCDFFSIILSYLHCSAAGAQTFQGCIVSSLLYYLKRSNQVVSCSCW